MGLSAEHINHNHPVLSVYVRQGQRDPSRTTALRNAFVSAMRRRFRVLRGLIYKAIVEEDVFGLRDPVTVTTLQTTPGRRAFAFPRSGEKVSAFMEWLRRQVDGEILQVRNIQQVGTGIEAAWTNKYIADSYRRGVIRARSQLTQGGFDVPSLGATGGIDIGMSTPFHLDRVGLLYTRTFNELKGITGAMDQQISRVLAQGMADGLGPRTIAKNLNHVISGKGGDLALRDSLGRFMPAERRAIILARTEIIRAHAEAQLQEYKNWGVVGVNVKAEWVTAGDNRVCARCADLEGSVFTIEQAQGMLPLHAQCRCAWVPWKEGTSIEQEPLWDFPELSEQDSNVMVDIKNKLGLSQVDTQKIATHWKNFSPEIDNLFSAGSPTCTVASGRLGQLLEANRMVKNVSYISGEFQEAGHWFNVVTSWDNKRVLLDFGNNIRRAALESGKIRPSVFELDKAKGYVIEDILTRQSFLKEMESQGWRVSMFENG